MKSLFVKVFHEEALDELSLDSIKGGRGCSCNGAGASYDCPCNAKGASFTCPCYKENEKEENPENP